MATEDAPAEPAAEPADEPMAEDGEAPASADDPGSKVFDN